MKYIIFLISSIPLILAGVYGLQFQDDIKVEKYKILDKNTGEYNIKYREVRNPLFGLILCFSGAGLLIILWVCFWSVEREMRQEEKLRREWDEETRIRFTNRTGITGKDLSSEIRGIFKQ